MSSLERIPEKSAVMRVTYGPGLTLTLHTLPDAQLSQLGLLAVIVKNLGLIDASVKAPAVDLTKKMVTINFVYPQKMTENHEYIFKKGITQIYVTLNHFR